MSLILASGYSPASNTRKMIHPSPLRTNSRRTLSVSLGTVIDSELQSRFDSRDKSIARVRNLTPRTCPSSGRRELKIFERMSQTDSLLRFMRGPINTQFESLIPRMRVTMDTVRQEDKLKRLKSTMEPETKEM